MVIGRGRLHLLVTRRNEPQNSCQMAGLGERKTSLWLFWSVARPLICRQIFGTFLTPVELLQVAKRRRRPRPQTTALSCNSTASVDSFAVCIVPALPVPWKLRPGIQSPPSRRAQSEARPCSRSPTLVPLGGEFYIARAETGQTSASAPGHPISIGLGGKSIWAEDGHQGLSNGGQG